MSDFKARLGELTADPLAGIKRTYFQGKGRVQEGEKEGRDGRRGRGEEGMEARGGEKGNGSQRRGKEGMEARGGEEKRGERRGGEGSARDLCVSLNYFL